MGRHTQSCSFPEAHGNESLCTESACVSIQVSKTFPQISEQRKRCYSFCIPFAHNSLPRPVASFRCRRRVETCGGASRYPWQYQTRHFEQHTYHIAYWYIHCLRTCFCPFVIICISCTITPVYRHIVSFSIDSKQWKTDRPFERETPGKTFPLGSSDYWGHA